MIWNFISDILWWSEYKFQNENAIYWPNLCRSSTTNISSSSTKKHQVFEVSSSSTEFSSSSSNGSYGSSPQPNPDLDPNPGGIQTHPRGIHNHLGGNLSHSRGISHTGMSRNVRAQSLAKMHSGQSSQNLVHRESLVKKSASEMSVKTLGRKSCDHLNNSDFWLRVVPSCKIRPRNCDEVPEEFKRAGIGLCFGGKKLNYSKNIRFFNQHFYMQIFNTNIFDS